MDRNREIGVQSISTTMMNYLVNRGKLTEAERDKILAMIRSGDFELRKLGDSICDTKWDEYISCIQEDIIKR